MRDNWITCSSSSRSRMPFLVSSIHSLQLWHFLLLVSAIPPPAVWSLRPRGPMAARPLCARRSPSALRPICIWDRTSLPEWDSRLATPRQRVLIPRGGDQRHTVRLRRQAAGVRPATPSGFEDGMPSSQYPWAIVWGPTVSDEDGGDANSANPGFPPLGYTFVSPRGMATAQPNSHSLLHNAGLNLRETPATLRPFLFGPRGEGRLPVASPSLVLAYNYRIIVYPKLEGTHRCYQVPLLAPCRTIPKFKLFESVVLQQPGAVPFSLRSLFQCLITLW